MPCSVCDASGHNRRTCSSLSRSSVPRVDASLSNVFLARSLLRSPAELGQYRAFHISVGEAASASVVTSPLVVAFQSNACARRVYERARKEMLRRDRSNMRTPTWAAYCESIWTERVFTAPTSRNTHVLGLYNLPMATRVRASAEALSKCGTIRSDTGV